MNIVLNYFLLLPFLPFYFFLPLYNLLPFETITIEGAFIVGTAMHSSMNRGAKGRHKNIANPVYQGGNMDKCVFCTYRKGLIYNEIIKNGYERQY